MYTGIGPKAVGLSNIYYTIESATNGLASFRMVIRSDCRRILMSNLALRKAGCRVLKSRDPVGAIRVPRECLNLRKDPVQWGCLSREPDRSLAAAWCDGQGFLTTLGRGVRRGEDAAVGGSGGMLLMLSSWYLVYPVNLSCPAWSRGRFWLGHEWSWWRQLETDQGRVALIARRPPNAALATLDSDGGMTSISTCNYLQGGCGVFNGPWVAEVAPFAEETAAEALKPCCVADARVLPVTD